MIGIIPTSISKSKPKYRSITTTELVNKKNETITTTFKTNLFCLLLAEPLFLTARGTKGRDSTIRLQVAVSACIQPTEASSFWDDNREKIRKKIIDERKGRRKKENKINKHAGHPKKRKE